MAFRFVVYFAWVCYVVVIMVTTNIGIRELKRDTPRLVRRASNGQRFVITRYGRPLAVLGPTGQQSTSSGARRLMDWQEERGAFERILPRLLRRYRGRYVAIWNGRVVDADPDHEVLFERVWRRFRDRTFFIGRVGPERSPIELPSFTVQ